VPSLQPLKTGSTIEAISGADVGKIIIHDPQWTPMDRECTGQVTIGGFGPTALAETWSKKWLGGRQQCCAVRSGRHGHHGPGEKNDWRHIFSSSTFFFHMFR